MDTSTTINIDAIRNEWLTRLSHLVGDIETLARSLDWTTRRIDKPMKDSAIGDYQAPGLLMQKEFARIILEPVSRSATGTEGLVELYQMPAFDDIASLYFYDGRWNIHFRLPNTESAT